MKSLSVGEMVIDFLPGEGRASASERRATLRLGDIVAKMIIERKHLDLKGLWNIMRIWSD